MRIQDLLPDPRNAEADRLDRLAAGMDTHAVQLMSDANDHRHIARKIRERVAKDASEAKRSRTEEIEESLARRAGGLTFGSLLKMDASRGSGDQYKSSGPQSERIDCAKPNFSGSVRCGVCGGKPEFPWVRVRFSPWRIYSGFCTDDQIEAWADLADGLFDRNGELIYQHYRCPASIHNRARR